MGLQWFGNYFPCLKVSIYILTFWRWNSHEAIEGIDVLEISICIIFFWEKRKRYFFRERKLFVVETLPNFVILASSSKKEKSVPEASVFILHFRSILPPVFVTVSIFFSSHSFWFLLIHHYFVFSLQLLFFFLCLAITFFGFFFLTFRRVLGFGWQIFGENGDFPIRLKTWDVDICRNVLLDI